jgi:hypothetical protein
MPRAARTQSIDAILRETANAVVTRISGAIAQQVAALVKEGVRRELATNSVVRRGAGRRPRGRGEITRWVADARARRVPNFVIEATGLDTKKKIVAKYGPGASCSSSTTSKSAVDVPGRSSVLKSPI